MQPWMISVGDSDISVSRRAFMYQDKLLSDLEHRVPTQCTGRIFQWEVTQNDREYEGICRSNLQNSTQMES